MTDQERLDEVIEHLTEAHLGVFGGYPYDYTWVGDVLVVAALDDAKERRRTQIERYERGQLLAWHTRALKYARKNKPDNLAEAFYETEAA